MHLLAVFGGAFEFGRFGTASVCHCDVISLQICSLKDAAPELGHMMKKKEELLILNNYPFV